MSRLGEGETGCSQLAVGGWQFVLSLAKTRGLCSLCESEDSAVACRERAGDGKGGKKGLRQDCVGGSGSLD